MRVRDGSALLVARRGCLLQGEAFNFPHRPFRYITLHSGELPDSDGAKELLQPVNQAGKLLWRVMLCGDSEIVLVRGHVFGGQDMYGRCFEAEIRLERGLEAIETQADQLRDMLRVPTWCSKTQIQRYRLPIHFKQQQPEHAYTYRIAGKIAH